MKERWRVITDFPDYEVSNRGRVRRATEENNTWSGRILSLKLDKDGYVICTCSLEGKLKTLKVHRLVCAAFNGLPFKKAEVRHRDGNRTNNVPRNLEWGTTKQNADDRDKHGHTRKGENHSRALYTQKQVDRFRADYFKAKLDRKYIPRGMLTALANKHGLDPKKFHQLVNRNGYQ